MKKNIYHSLCILILLYLNAIGSIAENPHTTLSIDRLWEKAAEEKAGDLPKSAISTLSQIMTIAQNTRNDSMLIRALKVRINIEENIDPENRFSFGFQLENKAARCLNPIEQAYLYSKAADNILSYYIRNRWSIKERSNLDKPSGDSPEEWSEKHIIDTIYQISLLSCAPDTLRTTPSGNYETLFRNTDIKKAECPTLYDYFLTNTIRRLKKINSENKQLQITKNIIALYDTLITFNKQKEETKAYIYNSLQKYVYSYSEKQINKATLLEHISNLEHIYKNTPYIADIILAKVDYYSTIGDKASEDTAYAILKKEIANTPFPAEREKLEQRLKEMTMPFFMPPLYFEWRYCNPKGIPGEREKLYLTYQNLDSLVISFYHSDSSAQLYHNPSFTVSESDLALERLEQRLTVPLNNTHPYRYITDSILLPAFPIGLYLYEIKAYSPDSTFSQCYLYPPVSNLVSVARYYQNGDLNIWVTTAKDGKPVPHAQVLFYHLNEEEKPIKNTQLETDKNGLCTYKNIPKEITYYRVCYKNDTIYPIQRLPYYYRGKQMSNIAEQTKKLYLFTDRGIYRPGDILYFKGILVQQKKGNNTIVQNTPIKISLYNPKGDQIAEKTLKTNDFGSINGTFQIPQENDANGYYNLNAENGSISVKLDHFKEPTFQITFSGDSIGFLPGEKVTMQGHAKNNIGIPLQNAKYEYVVTLRNLSQFYERNDYTHGKEQPINTGNGTCNEKGIFPIHFQTYPDVNGDDIQVYEITGTITDTRGETHPFEKHVKITRKRLTLQGEIQNTIYEDKINKNQGLNISIKGININNKTIPVHGQIELFHITKNDTLPIYQSPFDDNSPLIWNGTQKLPSGKYLIKATGYTSSNDSAVWQHPLILYSQNDKRPPIQTPLWIIENNTEIHPDTTISVTVGCSDKAYILCELFGTEGLINRKIIHLSNQNREIKIPYNKNLKEGGAILFTRVQNREIIQEKIILEQPQPIQSHIIWESWRNKLTPGQQDSISLRVIDENGQNIQAELLATMCDYSLFTLYPDQWLLNDEEYIDDIFVPQFENIPRYTPWTFTLRSAKTKDTNIILKNTQAADVSEEGIDDIAEVEYVEPALYQRLAYPVEPEQNTLRKNFVATAFFYPTLRADEKGRFNFTYQIPETLTKWYLRVLASTKNAQMQESSQYIITQKELMVQPLLPSFVREKDSVKIRTTITNLLPYKQTIIFSAEFFDPISKTILLKQEPEQITLPPSGEIVATTPLSLKNYIGRIGCRLKAIGTHHADGIEDYIDILPSYVTVQEGTTTELPAKEKWTFECSSTNGIPSEVTIKASSDLKAYAIQALPELTQSPDDDAVSIAATLYSATIAQYLQTTYPEIAATIQSPIYTQPNYANNLRNQSIQQLQTLQKKDGGWPWFKGMPSNTSITLQVVRHLAQLTEMQMTDFTEKERIMLVQAIGNLDRWIKTHYNTIKDKSKYTLENNVLEYLYIRAKFRDIPEPGDAREAIRYFTELARKQWPNKKTETKIMTYQLMQANGDEKICRQIINSIKEYPLPDDIRQATLLLKFYGQAHIEQEQTQKLIRFILNQKQYNTWRTPSETMDAIYALFEYDKKTSPKIGQIKISGINTQTEERNISPLTIDSIHIPFGLLGTKDQKIKIENTSNTPLWISATRKFNESLSSITPYDNGISIERTYFRTRTDEQGEQLLYPIAEGDTIKIGEQITVRLKIHSKNETSFVQIKDHFPANMITDGTLSGTHYNGNTWFYSSQSKTYKTLYIERLKRGTSIFEYKLYATYSGICRSGLPQVESLYAKEVGGHGRSTLQKVE